MLANYVYDMKVNGILHKACLVENETYLDESALNYIICNESEFLKLNINKTDEKLFFLYQLPEAVTVYEYIQNKLNRQQIMHLINGICTLAMGLINNGINIGYVVWDWNNIYFNAAQNKLQFILVPSCAFIGEAEEVVNLIRFIIAYSKYDLIENCHFVAVILSILNGEDNIKDMLGSLIKTTKKMSVEGTMRKKKEAVKTIDLNNSDKLSSVDIAKRSWGDFTSNDKRETGGDRPPVPCLVRLKTKENIQIYKDKFVLGKELDKVDYAIVDNPAVSRVHAFIEKKNGAFYVKDNNSSNRTFVDGKPVCDEEVLLINGMVLSLANEEFVYKIM